MINWRLSDRLTIIAIIFITIIPTMAIINISGHSQEAADRIQSSWLLWLFVISKVVKGCSNYLDQEYCNFSSTQKHL